MQGRRLRFIRAVNWWFVLGLLIIAVSSGIVVCLGVIALVAVTG
jgi:hypothetical protein